MEHIATINDLLKTRAERYPDKTFLYFDDIQVSYKELYDRSKIIGGNFLRLGVRKGEKIAILLPNCPEFIYAFFGIVSIGAVAVPINTLLKEEEVSWIFNNSEAKLLITKEKFEEVLGHREGKAWGEEVVESFDEASIIYTSGTTGRPKGAVLTHKNYITNAYQIAKGTAMNEDDRFLCILPLFHVNAQLVTMLAPMTVGGAMVLLRGFSPKEFLEDLARYAATAFSGVPTVYAILNSMPGADKYDLSSLRLCICGAAPMPVEVFKKFEEKYHATIIEGYGLSEATCASSINPFGGLRKIGSIGLPLGGQGMKIVDDLGKGLPQGEIGEIIVRGDVVMKEYFKNPEATKQAIKDGWLYTGDLGYTDKDGYFFIVGRKKEMIIRGGENIYPKEIEEVLYRDPRVQEAAVVGIPDKIWGEEVVCFLVLKEKTSFSPDEVIALCKSKLADYKCPRKVFYRAGLPKTATGKIQKNKITSC